MEICLRDESFARKLQDNLNKFRKSKKYCDLIVRVKNTNFHVHKLVFFSYSKLSEDSIKNQVYQNDCLEVRTMEKFIEYMYSPIGDLESIDEGEQRLLFETLQLDSNICMDSGTMASRLQKRFNIMKKEERLCDFTVKVEDSNLLIHRLVLAAGSDYFDAMFSSKIIESKSNEVNLQKFTIKSMAQVVEYLYTSDVIFNESNLNQLLITSHVLLLNSILKLCEEFVLNNKKLLTMDNCVEMARASRRCNLRYLYQLSRRFCSTHMAGSDSEQVLDLDESTSSNIVSKSRTKTDRD